MLWLCRCMRNTGVLTNGGTILMEYTAPKLLTSYAVPDLYSDAKGFASDPLYCDPNRSGDLGNYPNCNPSANIVWHQPYD